MDTPRPTPNPYARLVEAVSQLMRARRVGALDRPFATALGETLAQYRTTGWSDLSVNRKLALESLEDRDRIVAQDAVTRTVAAIERILPTGPADLERHQLLFPSLCQAAALAGERLVAMHMSGESAASIDWTAAALADLLQGAHIAGAAEQLAVAHRLSLEDVAPPFYAAALIHAKQVELTAPETIEKYRLAEGSRLSMDALGTQAATLLTLFRHGDTRIANAVMGYAAAAREAFAPIVDETPRGRHANPLSDPPKHTTAPKSRIQLGPLVGFASSARGGSEEARVEGALELFQAIVSTHASRTPEAKTQLRSALAGKGLAALSQLAAIVQQERHFHGDAEKRWREIDTELKILRQKAEAEARFRRRGEDEGASGTNAVAYPFPDEFGALECRVLYYQEAITRGVPLAQIISELYDSPQLTFGPTERQFFERVAFYAARKFAANLSVQSDPRVEQISAQAVRVEEVRHVLASIEFRLRAHDGLDEEALRRMGHELIGDAVASGDLRRDEANFLTGRSGGRVPTDDSGTVLEGSVVEGMITRIRAGQELRLLTALLALDGRVPDEIAQSYRDLPHVRRYALLDAPESRLPNVVARNGQPLHELERHTRARWMRYRQQAPAGRDVKPVRLDQIEDEDELEQPIRYRGQRPFQRKLPKVNPYVEQSKEQHGRGQQEVRGGRFGRPRN